MTIEEIEATVENFVEAARRVQEAGADGLEITASKGISSSNFSIPELIEERMPTEVR